MKLADFITTPASEAAVLEYLWSNQQTWPNQLIEKKIASAGRVSWVLRSLREKGHVQRETGYPTVGGREVTRHIYTLTAQGREFLEKLEEFRMRWSVAHTEPSSTS